MLQLKPYVKSVVLITVMEIVRTKLLNVINVRLVKLDRDKFVKTNVIKDTLDLTIQPKMK